MHLSKIINIVGLFLIKRLNDFLRTRKTCSFSTDINKEIDVKGLREVNLRRTGKEASQAIT